MVNEKGFSLLEVCAVISVTFIVLMTAVFDIRQYEDPSDIGAKELSAYIKEIRARAMANTTSYLILPRTSTLITVSSAKSCFDEERVTDSKLSLKMVSGAVLTDTDWSVCFNARGVADTSVDIGVQSTKAYTNGFERVQVMLGGAVRVVPKNS